MIDPIIENRFKELPASYQDFVVSGFPREIAEVFSPSLNLSPDQTDTLENGLILYLLFFFTKHELMEYVVNNTGANALETEDVIFTICKNLPDFANNDTYEQTRQELQRGSDFNIEIAEAENALRSIEGIRTMAHDMQEAKVHPIQPAPIVETTYQSNQADILRPVAPAPVVNETPRWDTEG